MDQQQIISAIRSNSFFALLTRDETIELIASGYQREYAADEVVFKRGEFGDAMYVVLEGSVRVVLSDHAPVKMLTAHDILGELALFSRTGKRTATIVSEGKSRLLIIPRDTIDYLSHNNPALAIAILRSALEYLIDSEGKLIKNLDKTEDGLKRTRELLNKSEYDRSQQERIARIDGLTGAYNRRAFDETLAETVAESAGQNVGLIYIDLDGFKQINDTYGHVCGDRILRMIVQVAKSLLRPQDDFYRIGGDEFAIIAPGMPPAAAVDRMEKLCRIVAGSSVMTDDHRKVSLTISIGGTGLIPGESLEDFMARTDSALYIAKNKGKNQICWQETE